jgi:UDP-N-acetyl-D-galactosamine dehydrogenase
VILAGRRVNNNIVKHVADETIKLMLRKNINVAGSKILVLGLTFKENCPDLRNTKIVNLINLLNQYNVKIDVFDPWVNLEEAKKEYGIDCLANAPNSSDYAAIILAVAHDSFLQMGSSGIRALGMANAVIYDVKGILPRDEVDGRL